MHRFGSTSFALALALSVAGGALNAQGKTASSAAIRPLAYTRVALPNGLVALLNEDHSSPLVVVDVWYHIGSKNDKARLPGMAHVCEHLMDLGSPNVDQPERSFYLSIGGSSPRWANTTEDITHYYVAVPSSQLETVLWAESDRMAAPFSRADSQRFIGVRNVVTQERQQNVENVPFGVARELTVAALFPAGHPYHGSPLSAVSELSAAMTDDIKLSCLPYYAPNNAIVSISGDFDTPVARALIQKYFGSIPPGPAVSRSPAAPVTLPAEKRLVLEDSRANQPRLQLDWPAVGFSHRDRVALRALASALSLNRFGRLSKLLVYDRQLATNVTAEYYDFENAGLFEILVLPRPGASMSTIETLVDSVLAALPGSPMTRHELARFNSYNAVTAVSSLQTRFARADTLAHGEMFARNPLAYAQQVSLAQAITPGDVQRVSKHYLGAGRVVMSLVPAGKLGLISKPNLPYSNVTPPSSVRGKAQP
jgi:zinc protease